jgi:hypothetical protein
MKEEKKPIPNLEVIDKNTPVKGLGARIFIQWTPVINQSQ